jgi:hypothetical protein
LSKKAERSRRKIKIIEYFKLLRKKFTFSSLEKTFWFSHRCVCPQDHLDSNLHYYFQLISYWGLHQ